MVVFAQLEFAITATSRDPLGFPEKEKTWDAIVGSFRPHDWLSKAMVELKAERGKGAGGLYGTAYKAAADGRYSEACALLEQCLRDDPDHILAHKKLAFVLKNMGDVGGALRHRQEVKRLDPSDTVNRFNLAGIYALLGAPGDALREADELLAMEPDNPMFLELRRAVARAPVAYPQHYEEESREHSGKARNLRLLDSIVPELPYLTHLLLQYHWEEHLPDEEARNLALRAIALVCCAIYDAALSAGLRCDPSPIPNGRRPAWLLEGEKSPVSLILSDIDFAERTCQMTIGPMMTQAGAPPGDRARWERLRAAFMKRFSELSV
jgi:tetratricopeptide (TPR) repeat protein